MVAIASLLLACGMLLAEPPTFQETLAKTPGFQGVLVPDTMDLVTEPTVPPVIGHDATGERVLVYTIAPKQKLTLKMTSGGGDNLRVELWATHPEHPLAQVIKAIMRKPPIMRAQKMELPNTTEVPQQVQVRLVGMTKVTYKVMAKREAL